jgi:hypothetical protein
MGVRVEPNVVRQVTRFTATHRLGPYPPLIAGFAELRHGAAEPARGPVVCTPRSACTPPLSTLASPIAAVALW